jgi:hypothetical protein
MDLRKVQTEMDLPIHETNFIELFEPVYDIGIDEYNTKKLNFFMLKTDANEFAYQSLADYLLEAVNRFVLSSKRFAELVATGCYGKLSKEARSRFRKAEENKGELGELLIYCFLESHLHAPKIFSKYELKTSPNDYIKGADGVHYVKVRDNEYNIIYCESKTYTNFRSAVNSAFKSISEFKRESYNSGKSKHGIGYERSLLSVFLNREASSSEETELLKKLILPSENPSNYNSDTAFGIFIGYETTITAETRRLPNIEFRTALKKEICSFAVKYSNIFKDKIDEYDLNGHSFYIYVLPFTDLDKNRQAIMDKILS